MIKLLKIEIRKILPYRTFWVMTILYLLSLIFLFYGFPSLIDYFSLRSDSPEIKLLKNFLYNYPDIWQNLTWIASLRYFIKIIPAIIVIMLVTNEYSYSTIRHNIINGFSREDVLLSKLYLAFLFSIISTIFILISGLILGSLYSSVTATYAMFSKMGFLLAYLTELMVYLTFSIMIGLLVKRTGFAISLLVIYPIIELIIQQKIPEKIHPYLPMNAMNHIIRTPNTSLIQYNSPDFTIDLQTHLSGIDFMIAIIYGVVFGLISWLILKKRDL